MYQNNIVYRYRYTILFWLPVPVYYFGYRYRYRYTILFWYIHYIILVHDWYRSCTQFRCIVLAQHTIRIQLYSVGANRSWLWRSPSARQWRWSRRWRACSWPSNELSWPPGRGWIRTENNFRLSTWSIRVSQSYHPPLRLYEV